MNDSTRSQKELFQLEDGITYLNCANMSPMLRSVKQAGMEALERNLSPWKILPADWFTNGEILRGLAAKIFQTNENNIALIPSASYGLATAAKNLKVSPGKEIIILEQQFPSNYYVWENMAEKDHLQLVTIKKTADRSLTENILEKINANTGIIAIPNCHWVDGTWIDLQKISDAAKTVGSYLVLDLSQSLGALPIDIERIQPDFAVSVGYKWMLGPYSLGYMYVSKKWHETGEPLEYSWLIKKGSEDFSRTAYTKGYRDGARKFDMGEFSQFTLLPMAIAALQQILKWNVAFIQSETKKLTDQLSAYKIKMGYSTGKDVNPGHIISIPVDGIDIDALKVRKAKPQ